MIESKKSIQKLIDILGREIKVGDLVAYPVRRRSTISLFAATIESIQPDGTLIGRKHGATVQVKLRYPNRCVVVERLNDAVL